MTRYVLVLLLCSSLLGGSLADAATYYVRNGGDDDASGLSHDDAWASLARINRHEFATSDSVLLREGDRWQEQLFVNWSGTAQRPAVIGAYRLDNGIPTRSISNPTRPIIDGADSIPQMYDALIRVRGDRVRVENLEVINSEGRAIQFEGADYAQVLNCVTSNTYLSGIHFVDSDHVYVYGNRVTLAGLANPQDGRPWGGAIELVRSDNGWIIRNTVTEVYGEGINAHYSSTNVVIERNVIHAARAVGIYLDAAPNATVRQNMIFGTSNPEFWRGAQSSGPGIALNNEEYRTTSPSGLSVDVQTRDTKVYANLVAFTGIGIAFWGQLAETSFNNAIVFNNTLVDNDIQFSAGGRPKPGAKFLNNIILSMSPGTRDVDTTDLGGMTARSNYFSQGDPGGDLSDTRNRYDDLALRRMAGWRTIDSVDDVSWVDFAIASGSSVIGTGDGEPLQLALGDSQLGLDFNAQPHNVPMDLGAIRFSDVFVKTPKTPTEMAGVPL